MTIRKTILLILTMILLLQLPGIGSPRAAGLDAPAGGEQGEHVTLNLALYKTIPDYDSFAETVKECWRELHPETDLNIVDWDCYSGEVPEDLDVFVFDSMDLVRYAAKGALLALEEKDVQDYDDLIPSFTEGCRVDGTLYALPEFLCTDLLYTRKGDAELENVLGMTDLYAILADDGLLLDKDDDYSKVCLYLQALIDENHHYMDSYPPLEEGTLSREAVGSLLMMQDMHCTDPEGVPEESGWYWYAKRFAEGEGRVYIGYSEGMDLMDDAASETDFRLLSMTDDENIPVFYMDAAAVNARIPEEKKALALELLNMITGKDLLVRASRNDGNPRYLLTARGEIYDALAPDYPIYAKLKEVALVPNAYVFRIRPDGSAYLDRAAENADLLPSL